MDKIPGDLQAQLIAHAYWCVMTIGELYCRCLGTLQSTTHNELGNIPDAFLTKGLREGGGAGFSARLPNLDLPGPC